MMLPSCYVYNELKGQSEKKIRNEIKKIKAEINRLKKEIEFPDPSGDIACPTPETRLKMNFEYLDAAKQALSDSGYEYIPTRKELKAAEFEKKIDRIAEIIYEEHGFFHGSDVYIIRFLGDKVEIYANSIITEFEDKIIRVCAKEEILKKLRAMRIGEWKKSYINPYVLDGYGWELEIKFNDGKKETFEGINEEPYNFGELRKIFGIKDEEESE